MSTNDSPTARMLARTGFLLSALGDATLSTSSTQLAAPLALPDRPHAALLRPVVPEPPAGRSRPPAAEPRGLLITGRSVYPKFGVNNETCVGIS